MHCFIVMTDGNWGRGPTIHDAATACFDSGTVSPAKQTYVELIIGDQNPYVDSYGAINRKQGSVSIRIGFGLKLGSLMRVETEPKRKDKK